jgi:cytochrome P450
MTASQSIQEPPVDSFDPFAGPNIQEPFPFLARLRESHPVYWNQQYSFWMLTRYKDVRAALQSPKTFSSATGTEIEKRIKQMPPESRGDFDLCYRFWYTGIQASDAPRHTQQRNPLTKAFAPAFIGQMQEVTSRRVERLVNQLQHAGTADFVAKFAYPLPSLVIFDLLGLPAQHHQTIREAAASIVKFPSVALRGDSSQVQQIAVNLRRAEVALKETILQRRSAPTRDVISALANDGDAASCLSDDDIIVLCNFLLAAGHETTANLLAGSMRHLLSERRQWNQLCAHPERVENAVEELLRFISPVLWVNRLMAEELELDGHILRKGDRVLLGVGAANHDPSEFTDPETLDLTRPKPHSLAFGYGPHFCIGAALARLETQIALSALLDRTPNITLESDSFDYLPIYFLRALKTLRVSV